MLIYSAVTSRNLLRLMAMTVLILCNLRGGIKDKQSRFKWSNVHSSLKDIYAKFPYNIFKFTFHHAQCFIRQLKSSNFALLILLQKKSSLKPNVLLREGPMHGIFLTS